jgi:hypothetical protein
MFSDHKLEEYRRNAREIDVARSGDEELGPLSLLPGTWQNTARLNGRGWNMIALPFKSDEGPFDFRVLVNQYNETLKFSLVDKRVPNRGIFSANPHARNDSFNTDQFVLTLDYEQMIAQIAADDSPHSTLAGEADLAIHHEPGLLLYMRNQTTDGIDIARLATIPHGNAALGVGTSTVLEGRGPIIPDISGLPIGVSDDLENNPYLRPYKTFRDAPFQGVFDPTIPNELLKALPQAGVRRTTVLHYDTTLADAGINNIPFIERQADASEMQSTFWIIEMEDGTDGPDVLLAYSQLVFLDFFPRRDGVEGLIRWPHVSINVMEKVAEPDRERPSLPTA